MARPISVKFHIEHPDIGRLKICSNGPGLMDKLATMPQCPYMVKTLKNLLLQNSWVDCLETLLCNIMWLSAAKFIQMVTLGWPWHIFQVKFGPLGFWMEKGEILYFSQNSDTLWYERRSFNDLGQRKFIEIISVSLPRWAMIVLLFLSNLPLAKIHIGTKIWVIPMHLKLVICEDGLGGGGRGRGAGEGGEGGRQG